MPGITDLIGGYVGDRSQQAAESTTNNITNAVKNAEESIQSATDKTISNVLMASNVESPDCNLIDPETKEHKFWVDLNNKINYKVYSDPQSLNNTGCVCINPKPKTSDTSNTSNSQIFKAVKIPNTNNYICKFEIE